MRPSLREIITYINVVFEPTLGAFGTGPSLPSSARDLPALGSGASIRGFVGRTRRRDRWRVLVALALGLRRVVRVVDALNVSKVDSLLADSNAYRPQWGTMMAVNIYRVSAERNRMGVVAHPHCHD